METSADPRAVATRARVIEVTRAVMAAEGPEAVTFARVAARAGVGRATVYRHWADLDALLGEVLDEFTLPFFEHPELPLDAWLMGQLRRLADELRTPTVIRLTTTLLQRAASGDAEARDRRDRLFIALEARLAAALGGVAQPADVAADLIGPLLYRCLVHGEDASEAMLRRLVGRALRG